MGLGDFIRKQFIDVIQWTEVDSRVLAYRVPMMDMEIQNGAQLVVREGQAAVFVNEGRVADVFGPGQHTLDTQNLPILTNLLNWDKAFESPFKSDVYFFATRLQLDQRWGTQTPITIRDAEFGVVRIRAFGTYAYRIDDPARFHARVSGTRDVYAVPDLEGQLRNLAVTRVTDVFASSGVPFLDMASRQVELSEKVGERMQEDVAELGLALDAFVVENLSLPESLQARLDERIGMGIVGDVGAYARYQAASSIPAAAANPGGAAGAGVGLGAGVALGKMMTDALSPTSEKSGVSCGKCGQSLTSGANFCPHCGTRVAGAS